MITVCACRDPRTSGRQMSQRSGREYTLPIPWEPGLVERFVVRHFITLGLFLILVFGVGCGESAPEGPPTFDAYPPMAIDPQRAYNVSLVTNLGQMTFKLLPNEAPLAVNSFMFLTRQGFYDGMTVHRVLPGILAETGDPTGTGDGGPGYTFEIEPPHRPYVRGDLVMANAGTPNSNGSRFFIILDDVSVNGDLPPDYTLVGQIMENQGTSQIRKVSEATLEKIGAVAVGPGPTGEVSAPQDQITIMSIREGLGVTSCKPGLRGATCG